MEGIYGLFAGLGLLAVAIILCLMLYQIVRLWKFWADEEEGFFILEKNYLKKFAEKQGIDLDKEIGKYREMNSIKGYRKEIKKKIREDILKEVKKEKK